MGVAFADQNIRRTGAGFFVGSGTVEDNPFRWIKFAVTNFRVTQGNIDGSVNVAGRVNVEIAHIHKHSTFII
jgi:hypothetical protein